MTESARDRRIHQKLTEIKNEYGPGLESLLTELNEKKLDGQGQLTAEGVAEQSGLRWTLEWTRADQISFEMNIVVQVEDDGRAARATRVWIHRRASTRLDYVGHTPTTRMRRVPNLTIADIRAAVLAEWP